jgi:predicted phage tail protein
MLPILLFLFFTSFQLMATDVLLAWDPSVTPEVTGYKVYIGNSSGTYSTPITIGSQTTYTVTGLTSGTYYFAVTAVDADGAESDFSNEVFQIIGSSGSITTPGPDDAAAPVIIQVSSSDVTVNSATITWTTNEVAYSQVRYGMTTSFGSSTTLSGFLATSHSNKLTGLAPNTVYHYRVRSADAAGNPAVSGDYTFTTAAGNGTFVLTLPRFSRDRQQTASSCSRR